MPFIGKNPTAGFATIVKDDFTADGTTTVFTLSKQVATVNDIAVYVGNVRQEPTDAYTVNGTTLTMSAAPATGVNFYVLHIAGTIESSVVPADLSIGTAKLVNDSVTTAKIAAGAVDTTELASGAVTSAKLDTNIAITGDLTVDTNTLHVDSVNNKVGLGIDPGTLPSFANHAILVSNGGGLSVTSSSAGDNRYIFFGNGTSSSDIQLAAIQNTNSDLIFKGASGSEKMRILNAGGITFNGDTAAANALDDYEEGTFTPTVTDLSGTGASSYSAQVGYYTKIGNMVYAVFRVGLTNKGSITGNYTLIRGLPFDHTGTDGGSGIVNRYQNLNNSVSGLSIELGGGVPSGAWFTKVSGTSGTSDTYLQTADVSNTFFAQGILIYRTS